MKTFDSSISMEQLKQALAEVAGKRGGNWASNPSMTRRMDAKFVDIVSYCK